MSAKKSKSAARLRVAVDPFPDTRTGSRAPKQRENLWQTGTLFHVSTRYPHRRGAAKVDRLAGILQHGLLAPAQCREGLVRSDLNLTVTGCKVPYESLVFLHRYGDVSWLYTICDRGRFAVFIDPTLPVLTPEDMGDNWPILCQDEVYVRDRVAVENLRGVAVHPADGETIVRELLADFQRLGIPLCDYVGNVFWSPR